MKRKELAPKIENGTELGAEYPCLNPTGLCSEISSSTVIYASVKKKNEAKTWVRFRQLDN